MLRDVGLGEAVAELLGGHDCACEFEGIKERFHILLCELEELIQEFVVFQPLKL
ncbi:hypothetical protein HanXRQr2_Chr05g0218941 [Helianthus annuus]|uniref:Uncharacterized protein n=1 Tax=Helianthus annuus TaxID=4232 RepID=A0A9K3J0U3_HELAN|nr:hypothetical protein HanXRQr2_Chr05g0218941 [Helianthus annuus]